MQPQYDLDALEKLYEEEKNRVSESKNRRNFVQQERVNTHII